MKGNTKVLKRLLSAAMSVCIASGMFLHNSIESRADWTAWNNCYNAGSSLLGEVRISSKYGWHADSKYIQSVIDAGFPQIKDKGPSAIHYQPIVARYWNGDHDSYDQRWMSEFVPDVTSFFYDLPMNFWYEVPCNGAPQKTVSVNLETYVEQNGKFSCEWLCAGCNKSAGYIDMTLTKIKDANGNSVNQNVAHMGYGMGYDDGDFRALIDRWEVKNLSAGYYKVTFKSWVEGSHPDSARVAGAYVWNMKIIQPYEAILKDVDNYDTANKIDLTYASDSKHNMQIPSAYAGSHWLRTVNPYSKLTTAQSYPITENGANWGSNTAANKYYPGYKYKSSTSASINQFESKVVYRYFEPIKYNVNIHKNRPANSTYDVTPSTSGYSAVSFSGEPANSVFQKSFVYNHTALEAPSTRFYLRGWTIADDANWYNTAATNGTKYAVGNKTLTTTENATLNLYPKYTPNNYTITYDTRLNQNSASQGSGATTTRTEATGNTDYSHGTVSNGIADCTGNNSSSGSTVNGKTKTVTFDSKYGTLLFPKAYWTTTIDANGDGTYVVQKGTTALASGTSEKAINTYSTFKGWSINKGLKSKNTTGTADSNYKAGSGAAIADSLFTTANGWWGTTHDGKVGLDKETKVQIDNDHTLYASWTNNGQKLGVPTRKYTVTFKDSDPNYKGTFVNKAGGNVNASGDLVKTHSWLFEGWYNRKCTIQTTIGGGVDHASLSNESKALNLGTMSGVTNKSSGYLNDGSANYVPTSNATLYAHWTDPGMTLPEIEKVGYEFIGWYTKPQTSVGQTTSGDLMFEHIGQLYGGDDKKNGTNWNHDTDKTYYSIDSDLTLYAWWNKKPIFVDIYEGLFFEGQHVSYNDLIELIGVFDYESNYKEIQQTNVKQFYDDLVQKIDQNIATDENALADKIAELDVWIYDKELGEDGEHNSTDYAEIVSGLEEEIAKLRDKIDALFKEKEALEQEREEKLQSIPERAKLLEVSIAEIKYYGIDDSEGATPIIHTNNRTVTQASNGLLLAKKNGTGTDKLNYDTERLKTMTENIGVVDIVYQVTDDGVVYKDSSGAEKTIPYSDVTLEYTRRCQINFNYNPMLYLVGVLNYSDETTALSDSIIKQQAVYDSCDVQDNIPWWGKGELNGTTDEGNERLLLHGENADTIEKLQDTMIITGVKDFEFSTAFVYEHQDVIDHFVDEFSSPEGSSHTHSSVVDYYYVGNDKKPIMDKSELIDKISEFSGDTSEYYNGVSKADVWSSLKNFRVTLDAHDQWGKWCSSCVSDEVYEDANSGVDSSRVPDGYVPKYNGGNDPGSSGPDQSDPNKPYDRTIYQNEDSRSTVVILINNDPNSVYGDQSLYMSRVRDNVRYVDERYTYTLGESYWGTYGKDVLQEILDKNRQELTGGSHHNGTYNTNNGDKVTVEINDYTSN